MQKIIIKENFISGMQDWLHIRKSMAVIHIRKVNEKKNHLSASKETQNTFSKINNLFMVKKQTKNLSKRSSLDNG